MKKDKWWVKVIIFVAGLVVKNQKGVKGTDNEKVVDNIKDLF